MEQIYGVHRPAQDERRGWRVLLADDDAIVQEVVRCAAERAGHQVIAATTGAQALELAITTQPDLIVLDIEFPDADGRDVLAKLKAEGRTAHIPVLVWSGRKVNDSDSRIALALGAEDYVEKNDVELLIRKLERVLLRFDETA
ncbi:MAG: response regulator [Pseudomonadota bacterium]